MSGRRARTPALHGKADGRHPKSGILSPGVRADAIAGLLHQPENLISPIRGRRPHLNSSFLIVNS